MFCHNCGKQIPDGTSFCRYCGAVQNRFQNAPAATAPPPVRTASQNIKNQQEKPSGSSAFANILSIAIIAVVAYFIFFYDTNDPRYPIETLYERRGDCEDTSILMAAMVRELGYEVGFLRLPGHLAVAVRATDDYDSSSYYEINGKRYVYIESTGSGWNIGDIPDDFLQTEVEFFPIP